MTVEERFWAKVNKQSDDECWLWTASLNTSGYGQLQWEGRVQGAARVSWKIHYGDPGSFHVLHHCDVRSCVNPRHLFIGSHTDNMKDMHSKGRWNSHESSKTHCPRGHEYSIENTWINKQGKRACRTCNRDKHRRMRDRRKNLGLSAKGPWVSDTLR